MSLIPLLLSILIFINWNLASKNMDNETKFSKIKSRIVSRATTIRNAISFENTIPINIQQYIPSIISKRGTKRKSADDDRTIEFDRIFAKWNKRPADLNCAWAPKVPFDRRRDSSTLRIASYNAEWLYLFGGNGSVKCPGKSCPWEDVSVARDHIFRTISLFEKIDADIIHLNEIEDCRILRLLMDLLPRNHGYRAYLVPGTDTMTGQNVGILTRVDPTSSLIRTENRMIYPVVDSTCGAKPSYVPLSHGKRRSGTMGLSKHYLTHFQIGGMKILWAGAHFIAHPGNMARCVRREAQATVLFNFVSSELGTDEEVIITGDFNDHDGEVPGANMASPQSSVLRILKSDKLGLQSAASFISNPLTRYSSWHDVNGNCLDDGHHEHSLIDHVLVSPRLAGRITSVWMDHNKTASCQERTSDHWPIIIDFRI